MAKRRRTTAPDPPPAEHIERYMTNTADLGCLMHFHAYADQRQAFRRRYRGVLNKSAIVVLTACWEAFIEDLVAAAFELLLKHARDHRAFPPKVLVEASRPLRNATDDRAVWALAGTGWQKVLLAHKAATFARELHTFHTPRTKQVNALCEQVLGLRALSSHWHWKGCNVASATKRLEDLISLRGEIAHRVSASRGVRRKDVADYNALVLRLVVASHEAVTKHLEKRLGFRPWVSYSVAPRRT